MGLTLPLHGRCHCGAVQYEISEVPDDVGFCHCRDCQITSGGPAQVWAMIKPENLTFTQGAPKAYASSTHSERLFCADCGSQMFFRYKGDETQDDPSEMSVNITTLANPETLEPKMHIWVKSQMPWLKLNDGLPTFEMDEGE